MVILLLSFSGYSDRFSLKTRWTTKSDQKTAFTDSLYLYVCGLASPHCTRVLTHLAKANGETGVQRWVEKRQALILKFLNKLCLSNTLTGPKVEVLVVKPDLVFLHLSY